MKAWTAHTTMEDLPGGRERIKFDPPIAPDTLEYRIIHGNEMPLEIGDTIQFAPKEWFEANPHKAHPEATVYRRVE